MKLPTWEECCVLYDHYHTPQHIRQHLTAVTTIALQLGQACQKHKSVSLPLIESAARLHDLVRIKEQWVYLPNSITTPLPHAEINYLLLKDQYLEVAEVIRVHSLMSITLPNHLNTLEKQIVYYADKRVNHANLVSITDRLALGKVRWGVTASNDQTPDLLQKLQQLEHTLFKSLNILPNDLHL